MGEEQEDPRGADGEGRVDAAEGRGPETRVVSEEGRRNIKEEVAEEHC